MLKENEDYELVTNDEYTDAWAIRILKGDFVESIVMISAIELNEKQENVSFNFRILSTPDPGVVRKDNVKLQEYVADIIYSVIETGLDEGFVELKERSVNELEN